MASRGVDRRGIVVALVLLSSVFGVASALRADPSPDDESAFVARIAAERSAAGLGSYTVAADLVSVARTHAEEMATEQRLHHNPELGSDVGGWQAVGENVGVGATVDDIHRSLMDSASHRQAILSATYTEVGVGVVAGGDGRLWAVEVFRRPATPAAAPPAPAPAPVDPPAAAPVEPAPPPPAPAPAPRRDPTAADRPAPAPAPAPVVADSPAPPADPTPAPLVLAAASVDVEALAAELAAATPTPVAPRRPVQQAAAPPATGRGDREVTPPITLAASLLVLVVAGLVATERRNPSSYKVSAWRRQRSQASINSSRSPSSTAWTLPVS